MTFSSAFIFLSFHIHRRPTKSEDHSSNRFGGMADATDPPKQPRKRQRPGLSCFECRRRKVKCNQARPCDQCTKGRRPGCSYDPRRKTEVLSTGPWAMGRPEPLEPSVTKRQDTGPMSAETSAAAAAQGLMGSITGSPNSEYVVNGTAQDKVSQPLIQPFPTPGTSPGMQVTGPERRPSTLGNTPMAQTPCSNESHRPRWTGSDQWSRSTPQAASFGYMNNVKRHVHGMEQNNPAFNPPSSEPISFIHSKTTDVSDVSAYGRWFTSRKTVVPRLIRSLRLPGAFRKSALALLICCFTKTF